MAIQVIKLMGHSKMEIFLKFVLTKEVFVLYHKNKITLFNKNQVTKNIKDNKIHNIDQTYLTNKINKVH